MQFLILFLRCYTRETTARGFPRTAVQVSHEINLFQVRIIIKGDATPLANLDYMHAHDQSQGFPPLVFSFGENDLTAADTPLFQLPPLELRRALLQEGLHRLFVVFGLPHLLLGHVG